jgi:hypothetical protein
MKEMDFTTSSGRCCIPRLAQVVRRLLGGYTACNWRSAGSSPVINYRGPLFSYERILDITTHQGEQVRCTCSR